ncbi:MAG: biotin--[acetyl-CoA-carboxylase] ligase [Bacteroidales bacterium]|nr:biotin--[acetyl-CoA-carboxylase] ligase [Bacteroidales bacterium]
MEVQKSDKLVVKLDKTTSTNTELKLLQQQSPLPEGSVVMADFQTGGRGQAGNSWYSGRGKNLLLSLLLYPHNVKARDQFVISRVVSLAIKRVLDRHLEDVTIKWPNDIYWKDKKIAGILIENSLIGQHIDYTIVGIGLNVNEEDFPEQLPNPISMKQIVGAELDRDLLFTHLSNDLFELYQSLGRGEIDLIEQEYMQHLYRREGMHWFSDKGGRFKATIKAVLPSGHLLLTTFPDKEERVYAFKEVSFEVDKE